MRERVAARAPLAHHLRRRRLLERGQHVGVAAARASSSATSNSPPATAAKASTRPVSGASRDRRRPITSLTPSGIAAGSPPSARWRRTCSTKNGLPPVSRWSRGARRAVGPRARRPRRRPVRAAGRARSGRRGAGPRACPASGWVARDLGVAIGADARPPACARRSRCASSRSVPASAQWRSSSSSTRAFDRGPRSPRTAASARPARRRAAARHDVRAERLHERLVGRQLLLVAAAVSTVRGAGRLGQLREQPRLADPRLAGERDQAPGRDQRAHAGQLRVAAGERACGRQRGASRRVPSGGAGPPRISSASARVCRDGATAARARAAPRAARRPTAPPPGRRRRPAAASAAAPPPRTAGRRAPARAPSAAPFALRTRRTGRPAARRRARGARRAPRAPSRGRCPGSGSPRQCERLLGASVVGQRAHRERIDPGSPRQPDRLAARDDRVLADRAAQVVQRGAQARAGAGLEHVGPEARSRARAARAPRGAARARPAARAPGGSGGSSGRRPPRGRDRRGAGPAAWCALYGRLTVG